MKKIFPVWILLIGFVLNGCGESNNKVNDSSAVLATVEGQNITVNMLTAALSAEGVTNADEVQRAQALDQLLNYFSLAQEASKKGMSLDSQQAYILDYLEIKAKAQLATEAFLQDNPITEKEIEEEYARVIKNTAGKEYLIHHLLYADDLEAIATLDRIKAQNNYLTEQAAYLQDNPEMSNVGPLGWVNILQLPESFHAILPSMQSDTVYPEVINSRFGAHVVYLQDTREINPPSIEQARTGLVNALRNRKLEKYRQLVKIKSDIKLIKNN